MVQRYDCLVGRPKHDGGTWWHKIGTAFEGKDGGMNVTLDSLPLQDKEGRCGFIIRPAKDLRQSVQQSRQAHETVNVQSTADIDDSVPF